MQLVGDCVPATRWWCRIDSENVSALKIRTKVLRNNNNETLDSIRENADEDTKGFFPSVLHAQQLDLSSASDSDPVLLRLAP
jgi:hypothetical protein